MDIEDLQKPIDDKLTNFVISLSKKQPKTHKEYEKIHKQLRRKYRICPSKIIMNEVYQNLVNSNRIQKNPIIEYYLIKKAVRSRSGVVVITVVMKPDKFSCTKDCYYCPNETKKNGSDKDMPRSYLSTEPAVMRGSQNDFDACLQMWSRMNSLRNLGHKIDKLEIIVLGGTFSIYPREYQEEFAEICSMQLILILNLLMKQEEK